MVNELVHLKLKVIKKHPLELTTYTDHIFEVYGLYDMLSKLIKWKAKLVIQYVDILR